MPSFDIVSEMDFQEVDNAVNQVHKEIGQRFDFRGGKSEIAYEKDKNRIRIVADDDMKLRAIHQMLEQKLAKRNQDMRGLKYGKEEQASGGIIRQMVELKAGLDKEESKKITKIIKDSKLKVQAEIQGEQIRVTGKQIDDLQDCIKALEASDVGVPLKFINMRR